MMKIKRGEFWYTIFAAWDVQTVDQISMVIFWKMATTNSHV